MYDRKVRVNITVFDTNKLNGYNNIDLQNAKDISDDEASEIICDGCLDYVSMVDKMKAMQLLVKKLKVGGLLVLSGDDLYEICRAVSFNNLSVADGTLKIFGEEQNKSHLLDLFSAAKALEQLGIKIETKRVNSYKYTITGTKV